MRQFSVITSSSISYQKSYLYGIRSLTNDQMISKKYIDRNRFRIQNNFHWTLSTKFRKFWHENLYFARMQTRNFTISSQDACCFSLEFTTLYSGVWYKTRGIFVNFQMLIVEEKI